MLCDFGTTMTVMTLGIWELKGGRFDNWRPLVPHPLIWEGQQDCRGLGWVGHSQRGLLHLLRSKAAQLCHWICWWAVPGLAILARPGWRGGNNLPDGIILLREASGTDTDLRMRSTYYV